MNTVNIMREMQGIWNEFDVMFQNINSNINFEPVNLNKKFGYPVDIIHSPKKLEFNIAALGIPKDEIDITIESDVLKVKFDKKENEKLPPDHEWITKNITRKAFNHGWKISPNYDLSKINVDLSDGLLSIVIPISDKAKPRTIKIQ